MTGAPILTQAVAGVRLAVEVAWGANLTDLSGASWTWTDITADVLMGGESGSAQGGVSITMGRADESSETQPSVFTCWLDNRSARYSLGGVSPSWPNVRRGTPVRCRVSTDSGATWSVKYQGNAVSWQPGWDAAGRFATVLLTASGPLRQLNQGLLPAVSTIRSGTLADPTVWAYWPCEDGQYASQVQPATQRGAAGFYSTYNYSTGTAAPGAPAKLASHTAISASAPVLTTVSGGAVAFLTGMPTSNTSQASVLIGNITDAAIYSSTSPSMDPVVVGRAQVGSLITVATPSCSIKSWDIVWQGNGVLEVSGYPSGTFGYGVSRTFAQAINFAALIQPNVPYEIGLNLTKSGSNVNWQIYVVNLLTGGPSWFNGTQAASGTVEIGTIQLNTFSVNPGVGMGHVTCRMSTLAPGSNWTYVGGYIGESVTDRIGRMCQTNGIPGAVIAGTASETSANPADAMGTQYCESLSTLLRECEATAQGILFDGRNIGLTYRTRQSRGGQSPTLTLDATAGEIAVAFEPIDDDQGVTNQVTITRRNGSSVTYTDTTSARSPRAIGLFSTSTTVNPQSDTALAALAAWLVHLGTLDGYRYPTVRLALDRIPSKIAGWLNVGPASWLDITNITKLRAQHPDGTIRLIVEGWTETIDAFTWNVTVNASRRDGWNVGRMAAATGTTGDSVMRRDTDGSATNAAYSAGATSVAVKLTAAGKPLWTTAADDFPMVVSIGGTPVTVTAISGAASPQTFTLAAPGLPYPVAANAEVRLWNPPVLGM